MKAASKIELQYIQTPGVRLLVGRVDEPITAGSMVALRKIGDDYYLQFVEQSGDASDPQTLASFLDPATVDHGEAYHAACIALEAIKAKRKPKNRKSA